MTHVCHDCQEPIPAGQAVIRSVSLVRVAFHGTCWYLRREVSAILRDVA